MPEHKYNWVRLGGFVQNIWKFQSNTSFHKIAVSPFLWTNPQTCVSLEQIPWPRNCSWRKPARKREDVFWFFFPSTVTLWKHLVYMWLNSDGPAGTGRGGAAHLLSASEPMSDTGWQLFAFIPLFSFLPLITIRSGPGHWSPPPSPPHHTSWPRLILKGSVLPNNRNMSGREDSLTLFCPSFEETMSSTQNSEDLYFLKGLCLLK